MMLYDMLKTWSKSPVPAADLEQAFVIRAQNIADYFYVDNSKEDWLLGDFHNVAPPFERMWFEFDQPRFSNNNGKMIEYPEDMRLRRGILVQAFDLSSQGDGHWLMSKQMRETYGIGGGSGTVALNDLLARLDTKEDRWLCQARVFAQQNLRGIPMPPFEVGQAIYLVGPTGLPSKCVWFMRPETIANIRDANMPSTDSDEIEKLTGMSVGGEVAADLVEVLLKDVMMTWHQIPFMSLSFIHCKNVSAEKEVLDRAERRRRERDEAKGYVKQTVPHIVRIEPMKKTIKGALGSETMSKAAMHIVRGHFRDYGVDGRGLLFGKYSGRYFVPAHTAGSVGSPVKNQYDVSKPVKTA